MYAQWALQGRRRALVSVGNGDLPLKSSTRSGGRESRKTWSNICAAPQQISLRRQRECEIPLCAFIRLVSMVLCWFFLFLLVCVFVAFSTGCRLRCKSAVSYEICLDCFKDIFVCALKARYRMSWGKNKKGRQMPDAWHPTCATRTDNNTTETCEDSHTYFQNNNTVNKQTKNNKTYHTTKHCFLSSFSFRPERIFSLNRRSHCSCRSPHHTNIHPHTIFPFTKMASRFLRREAYAQYAGEVGVCSEIQRIVKTRSVSSRYRGEST